MRTLRVLGASVLALLVASACGRSPDAGGLTTDTGALTTAGDVSADSATVGAVFHGVKYPLTSQNYRKWIVAQAALDSVPEPSDMPRVDLRDPTDDNIERTVDYLDAQDAMRRAIERSGLSVRDFVLTSVALGQALNVAGRQVVPQENRVFVDSNRVELERVRAERRFHVVDDEDGDHDRGHGHGHGHGGKGGHGHKHHNKHGKG